MRTVSDDVAVRLYHLDPASGVVTTVMYGTLAQAMAHAAGEDEAVQDDLFLQTPDDVVSWSDLANG